MPLDVHQFPCLDDNYGFLIRCPESGITAAIDTPDAAKILEESRAIGWDINEIWNTHHHWDHAGGNAEIVKASGATITGPAAEADKIGQIDHPVSHGDRVRLGTQEAEVLDVGGHTLGHIAYYFPDSDVVFCGDALFALGCGRMFEGTPEQFVASLQRLKHLPGSTSVYCAHEYTAANARFAMSVDPDNALLQAYAHRVEELREAGQPTVPTRIDIERQANPFLRWDDKAIRARLGLEEVSDIEVFAELRQRKDHF